MHTCILWGEMFDEAFAVTVAVRLRRAGLAVQLVGLQGRQATGAAGLLLGCDLTLGEALPWASTSAAVVVPAHTPTSALELNPRAERFLATAHEHGAAIVTGRVAPIDAVLFPCALHRLQSCPTPATYDAVAERLCALYQ
ncbi:MAG: hypothetical protein R2867_23615 [Caldilineaceae bacterium]